MYQSNKQGWLKHVDFLLLDIIIIQLSYLIGYSVRHQYAFVEDGFFHAYKEGMYQEVAVIIFLATIIGDFATDNHRNILKRGILSDLKKCVELFFVIGMACVGYLFLVKKAEPFSRSVIGYLAIFGFVLVYISRLIWKKLIISLHKGVLTSNIQTVVVCPRDAAGKISERIEKNSHGDVKIKGLALLGEEADGPLLTELAGYPVLCRAEDLFEYLQHDWVDELIIYQSGNLQDADWILDRCEVMGLTAHLCLDFEMDRQTQKIIEKYCGYYVLTESPRIATQRQMMMKRLMDIVGGLVGLLLTAILTILVGPLIFVSDPGPIFYSQVRKGKNGRDFRMYKFRSMYKDAEARKKQLAQATGQEDQLMFKLEHDPRIIGQKERPDGTWKKGIGGWIRDLSLDELPQFFNVLKGDMSLVGTRPPTVDEWRRYEPFHRSRMSTRPGITGLWQVSGRSKIRDFDTVVRLDREYIENWSIKQDIRILVKTVAVVLTRKGAM